jgi:predicted MFS family arabinose efflux permease
VAVLTAPVAVLVDAVSYLGSAGLILSIREVGARAVGAIGGLRPGAALAASQADDVAPGPESGTSVAIEAAADAASPSREGEAAGASGSMASQIKDGLRYILRHEYLGNIAATTATSNLFGNIGFAIFPVYAYRELEMSPAAVGTVGGVGGAGVLLGALLAARIQKGLGIGRTIVLAAALFGPINLLLPLASPQVAIFFLSISFFLGGITNVVYNVAQVSLRQAITPEHFLGRMNATMRFLVWGTIPIGSLIGAGLSGVVGVQGTVWISAILSFFACVPVIFSSVRKVVTMPTGDPG